MLTPAMSDPILKVEHLSMKFGGLVAIGDLSFEAKRGEITALIGPNGAGKTTVFNCITGFYKPTEGMITLTSSDGKQFLLERMPDHEITAKAKVARTFQNIRLFSGMTLLENLLVAQHNKLMKASGYHGARPVRLRQLPARHRPNRSSWPSTGWKRRDLVDRADDPAGDLPYGAQRRLEIARAMCTGPELLCLDEPAAGLNPRESAALNALLNDIKDTTGTSILLIEHDMSVVMQISDHVVVLEYGRKISDGDPTIVKNDPRVIAAYLGVDDEEVGDVLTEVGDEQVHRAARRRARLARTGRHTSSSMMAGPVTDSIGHSDPGGERVTIAPKRLQGSSAGRCQLRPASRSGCRTCPPTPPPQDCARRSRGRRRGRPRLRARLRGCRRTARFERSAPRGGKADKLTLIKGIGPVNEKKLNEHGIFHFDQIAAWTQGRRRGGRSLSGLRRAHRARGLDRPGEAPCRRAAQPAAAKRGGK